MQTEEREGGGGDDIYQRVGRNRAARVILCKYFDSITSGHIISHFNAPFLSNLKIEGKGSFKPAQHRQSSPPRPHITVVATSPAS